MRDREINRQTVERGPLVDSKASAQRSRHAILAVSLSFRKFCCFENSLHRQNAQTFASISFCQLFVCLVASFWSPAYALGNLGRPSQVCAGKRRSRRTSSVAVAPPTRMAECSRRGGETSTSSAHSSHWLPHEEFSSRLPAGPQCSFESSGNKLQRTGTVHSLKRAPGHPADGRFE